MPRPEIGFGNYNFTNRFEGELKALNGSKVCAKLNRRKFPLIKTRPKAASNVLTHYAIEVGTSIFTADRLIYKRVLAYTSCFADGLVGHLTREPEEFCLLHQKRRK